MVRGHRQFAANFVRFQTEHFAHHEDACGCRRQAVQAGLENSPEAHVFEGLFRISPSGGLRCWLPVAVRRIERRKIVFIDFVFGRFAVRLASAAPDDVDNLVAQDREDPGLESSTFGEAVGGFERGKHRFLYGVLGACPIAQLEKREAQHVTPEAVQLAGNCRRFGRQASTAGRAGCVGGIGGIGIHRAEERWLMLCQVG